MSSLRSSTLSYPSVSEVALVSSNTSVPVLPKFYPPERYRGLSCLAVGAGAGGSVNMVAKVVVVDYWGNEMLDTYVRPTEPVIDYRTTHTGIEEKDLSDRNPRALPFDIVQAKVTDLISGYTVVGYSLWNDLSVLGISHLAINTRDVGLYLPFRATLKVQSTPGLSTLVWTFMMRHIECTLPDPAENARACMDLFRSVEYDRLYVMQLATNEVQKVVVNLADLCQSQENFIDKASRNAHVDKQHAGALGNTIQTLTLDLESPGAWPYFAVPALTLVPPKGPLPESEALKQTSIGSLLAGPGSESDEFADVGFWCGEIDENNKEVSILQALSLDPWVQKGSITRLDDAPLKTLRKSEMWELCEALTDLTEFRIERPDAGCRVLHVLAGKGLEGWCGLIGVGIWSDE
ncbi:unnamed protein product [Rhizoctonia solani]|uniref:Exonuclease domain-containing protein n=1 Tax=Rhizoctonia solani TaxID=456999 RepID=A0A8H3DKN3_9AGAM|nr:unnamed protein product [Rhizoctonia solani]